MIIDEKEEIEDDAPLIEKAKSVQKQVKDVGHDVVKDEAKMLSRPLKNKAPEGSASKSTVLEVQAAEVEEIAAQLLKISEDGSEGGVLEASMTESDNFKDYAAKRDVLRAHVDSALESLKVVGSESVKTNIVTICAWFIDVLHQIDLVELRRDLARQIEAPRVPTITNDMGETSLLHPLPQTLFTRSNLTPAHMFVKTSLLEDHALEVFKIEIREELSAQRKKQEALEAQMGSIVENQ